MTFVQFTSFILQVKRWLLQVKKMYFTSTICILVVIISILQITSIIKWVTWNKSTLLLKIDLQTYKNITTKLNWKLFTKVIKIPSEAAWIRIDWVSLKRSASA